MLTSAKALICMLPFLPESHMYHVRKGNNEKAKKSMTRIYGNAAGYDLVGRTDLESPIV